jgi:hypothetical protein
LQPFSAIANNVSVIELSTPNIVADEEFNIVIKFKESPESVSCSINIDWGDGQKQKIKLGKGAQIAPPFHVFHVYNSPGVKKFSATSPFLGGCEVNLGGNLVVESKAEKQIREEKLAAKIRQEKEQAEAAKAKQEAELAAKKEAEEKERLRKESPEYKKQQAEKALKAKQDKEAWDREFAKLNLLEKAVNPFGGNKPLMTEFKEEGGLNTLNSWFGVYVLAYSTQSDAKGFVSFINVNGASSTPIKKMRSIANAFCGLEDSEWKKDEFDSGKRMTGEAKNQRCEARYDNYVNGQGIVSISIKRLVEID